MAAMRVHATGEALQMDEVPVPRPGPGQVVLRVHAAGVNFADTLMVKGRYQERPEMPFAPGLEVCGTVVARGEGVTEPAIGTRVAAMCSAGGFAEAVAVPASACVPVPDAMSDADAAVIQVAYGTAHLALGRRAGLRPGERLLVLGAAGGVGLTAIEVGRLMGAEVIAVARGAERLETARQTGAHHLIDSDTGDIRTEVKALGGADVVFDPVGGDQWVAALRAANAEARLLPIGFASGEVPQIPANILLVKNLTVIGLYWGGYAKFAPEVLAESLAELIQWHAAGRITPHVSHTLPLAEANEALRLLTAREATGKVVLEMGRA
ncbi:MAG: NADPH:quinone oxidoreductase family protein [Pseudomonadota bacterium]